MDREEHFYQLGLRQFGAFHRLKLDPPPLLKDLIRVGAEDEPDIISNGLDMDHVVEVCPFLPREIHHALSLRDNLQSKGQYSF